MERAPRGSGSECVPLHPLSLPYCHSVFPLSLSLSLSFLPSLSVCRAVPEVMKPPVRARAAPRRYGMDLEAEAMDIDGEGADWSVRAKRLLLRALKKQSSSKEPDLSSIASEVPGKTREQIAAYLEELKLSSIRSIIQRNYLDRLREKRLRRRQLRAPLQTLMIAATEPRCQASRAVPTDPTLRGSGDGTLPGGSLPGSVSSAPPPVITVTESSTQSPGAAQALDMSLDFAKIYKYLSATARGSTLPQLSAFESAVVLDLLMSLPDQIQDLDCQELWTHMNTTYRQLTSTASAMQDAHPVQRAPSTAQGPSINLTGQTQASGPNVQPAAQTHSTTEFGQSKSGLSNAAELPLESDWPAPCPLNPFRLPVKLLVRCEAPTAPRDPVADLGSAAEEVTLTLSAVQPSADLRPPAKEPALSAVQPSPNLRPAAEEVILTLTAVQPSPDLRPPAEELALTTVQPSPDPRPPAEEVTLTAVQPSPDLRPPAEEVTLTLTAVQPSPDLRPPAEEVTLTAVQPSPDLRPPAEEVTLTLTAVQPSPDLRPPAEEVTLTAVQPSPDPRHPAEEPTLTTVLPSTDP
ncbi:snRNA-activating protein complex subunit 2 isoform X2 [Hemiscyllium ocellatum]|uniref:snRNA-activating protein complex subunit 2 isoform X2 n=1 Tax=Hemiscyllium ocellatum TaxID=170820 RepID=UPI002966784D|nr:snRNA-activating protein complex subunit 2 isoform X2 [Hemiscyllium ocellatum]